VAARLERAWKEFAAGLDERNAVLSLSVMFHHKAEQVMQNSLLKTPSQIYPIIHLHGTCSKQHHFDAFVWSWNLKFHVRLATSQHP
jgi:hypothetical protein